MGSAPNVEMISYVYAEKLDLIPKLDWISIKGFEVPNRSNPLK